MWCDWRVCRWKGHIQPMRTLTALLVCMVLGTARADVVPHLYRGETIVTGQENLDERERGFREALAEAVVKVSGDARLPGDPRLAPVLQEAGRFVDKFEYEDRLAKKKLMDEQGTRERSYFLRVDFNPAAVNRLLAELGARPWPADRPRLLVLLVVRDSVGRYLLADEGARGWGQREALAAIARRRGVPVVLPRSDAAGEAESGRGEGEAPDAGKIRRLENASEAAAVLHGEMTMQDNGLWDTDWMLQSAEGQGSWRTGGTTFDRAIATGVESSALRLAGLQ